MNVSSSVDKRMFESLMTSQALSPEALRSHAEQQLQNTLAHAARTAPFFRQRLSDFADNASAFDLERFRNIPLLTRDDLKDDLRDIASQDMPKGHGEHSFGGTSGTSGMPILVKRTRLVGLMQTALQNRFFANMKLDRSHKMVLIKGDTMGDYPDGETTDAPWLPKYISNSPYAPVISLRQPVDLIRQLEFLNRQGRCYLTTQPSNLAGLAVQLQQNRENFPDIDVAGILTIGELVQPYHRKLAKEQFFCPIMDQYTAAEAGNIATQCSHGNLHVNVEALHVETLRDDGTVSDPGEEGRIIVTSTINWATMLIRYDIGDRGVLSQKCSCGSALPVLKLTVGRQRNLFKFSDGTSVLGLLSPAQYHDIFPIRQWQLAQTAEEEITIRYTSDHPEDAHDRTRLAAALKDYFNRPQLSIRFDRRDRLELTETGKLQEAVREYS